MDQKQLEGLLKEKLQELIEEIKDEMERIKDLTEVDKTDLWSIKNEMDVDDYIQQRLEEFKMFLESNIKYINIK